MGFGVHSCTPLCLYATSCLYERRVMAETQEEKQTPDIISYIHCRDCMTDWAELKDAGTGMSPAEFQDNEVGFTPTGVQVWCRRHDKNVISFDFLR